MIENIANPDLEYLFDEDSDRFKTKEYLELSKLYEDSMSKSLVVIPECGEIITASYRGISAGYYIFSANGLKDDIRVDLRPSESKYLETISIGDSVDLLIVEVKNDLNFIIVGSIASLHESKAHDDLMSSNKSPVTADVVELTPAGYSLNFKYGGVMLTGFMPNTLAGVNKLSDPESILNTRIEVLVESFSRKEGTYILSRKSYLETLIPSEVEKLEYNKIYSGYVTGTTPFGVFVEFNDCLTGMIHKVNLHEDYQHRMSEVKPGLEVEFYIKEIVREKNNRFKIILTQVLRETLWDTVKNGQVIDGVVKDSKQFGTLVILDEETMGLIHSSEMAKLDKSFTKGQNIRVKVLSTDRVSRKIFLTIAK
jgi:ribosomal protein S1